ncbi:MAG: flagellar biosynthesis [Firmicutes bacterium]|nr:flagellar biosynthesis [Bacillota bacterium]
MSKEEKRGSEVAAALSYSPDENQAPVVVAGGKGYTAKYIKELAQEHNIPVYKDENLAHTLLQLGVGTEIPESLYEVVAEILVFVAEIDKKVR